jgi:hypothetical protein
MKNLKNLSILLVEDEAKLADALVANALVSATRAFLT